MITEVITRRKIIEGKKYWFTTNSVKRDFDSKFLGPWANTLYIHFAKDDFPNLKYPITRDTEYKSMPKIFDYNNCSVAELPWHRGITFYEETINVISGKTYVKAGCDYSHLGDDAWESGDYGKTIIERETEEIAKEFEKLAGLESK